MDPHPSRPSLPRTNACRARHPRRYAAAVLSTTLMLAACSEPRPPEPPASSDPVGASAGSDTSAPPPNLLIVVLDTVRADHLSCYGYERPTSPAVDAFAAQATRFTRALSSAPWTLPSHASMLTGLDPRDHGVHTVPTTRGRVEVRPLAAEHVTLAEGLGELGYRTAAMLANSAYLDPRFGLDQGFDTYIAKGAPGLALNEHALRWIRDGADGRPWFLLVNYMEAHRPYAWAEREEVVPGPVERRGTVLLRELMFATLPGERDAPLELVRRVVDQYDIAISCADEAFGHLLEGVRAVEGGERTVVVVTSDHGEAIGEHRLVEHGKDVYQPSIGVPLVIGHLGRPRAELDERTVTSADLIGLLFEAVEHPRWEPLRALFPVAPGSRPARVQHVFGLQRDFESEQWGHRFRRVRRASVEWPWKLIHSSDGAHELYHLERDPQELSNRYAEEPEVVARLRAALAVPTPDVPEPIPDGAFGEVDPELLEELRALGYAE